MTNLVGEIKCVRGIHVRPYRVGLKSKAKKGAYVIKHLRLFFFSFMGLKRERRC